jgi:hypothetical protein
MTDDPKTEQSHDNVGISPFERLTSAIMFAEIVLENLAESRANPTDIDSEQ